MKNFLALIPARGGSKGIPKKNLYPIMNKPLLEYTLDAAFGSTNLKQVHLSSEDSEIIHFAKSYGVSVDYVRPAHLATDEATTLDVVLDFLDWQEANQGLPDALVLLQPTSPLRGALDIDQAIHQFIDSGVDSLVSVHEMTDHPNKCIRLSSQSDASSWQFLLDNPSKVTRRQDYANDFYTINGAIYISTPSFIRKNKNFVVAGKTSLFKMNPVNGVDVDEIKDIFQVESYLKMMNVKK